MPDNFRNELVNSLRNGFCTILAVQNNYYGYVSSKFPFPTANYARNFFGLAYRLVCNREPPPAPTASFTGGQCLVNYNWGGNQKLTRRSSGAITNTPFTRSPVAGKIGEVVVTEETDAGFPVYRSRIPSTNAAGAITYTDLGTVRRDIYFQPEWNAIAVSRVDGLPDNCGNLPGPTPTPTPGYNNTLVTVNYTDNSSTNITLNARFRFAGPIVKIDGSIRVPIRIDLGDVGVQIGGDINLNTGEINIDFNNCNYNPTDEPNPDTYRSPDDTPTVPPDVPTPVLPPSPDSPQSDTTTIIRACVVTVSSISPQSTLIPQVGNPDIYAPNLGFIQFLIASGNSLAWTSDIPVKNKRNFISCPWIGGAIAVRGTPRPGVAWTISPVYDKAEQPASFT